MKNSIPLCIAAAIAPSFLGAQVIVDDSWADFDFFMNNLDGELDAEWFSSSASNGNSLEVPFEGEPMAGTMGLVTGTAGRGIHATFAPQMLAVGDTLATTATFTTPATVGTNRSTAFKIGLADFNNEGLAANLTSNSSTPNPLYTDLPAYMVDFDVNKPDMTDNITVRKHNNPNTTGRFMGTTGEWTSLGGSPDDVGGYTFLPDTEYVVVVSLTRTGEDTMDITASLSQDGTELVSHTAMDPGAVDGGTAIANNIGLLGYWVNSNTFGSDSSKFVPDNGITFSNVLVELNPGVEPEPPSGTTITSVDFDAEAGSVTIEWDAEIGTTYFVYASNDLLTWDEELDDVTAASETESFTETDVPAGVRFYRVETLIEE